jgi:hypothetical protein
MEVKPLNAYNSITALATYQRTVQIILRRTTPPAPVSRADATNCVEIRTPTTMHIMRYQPLTNPLTKDKGVFVNVWV